ncbi:MAG: thioredoxin family protein [Phycisphaeraceae bacterium]|nr:thioredoxin family protein [Phycisphaeraceae bacterium]
MFTQSLLRSTFEHALAYPAYVATGTHHQQQSWNHFDKISREHAPLSQIQNELIRSFTRRINILVLSGTWCGDCVHQCPLFQQLAEVSPVSTGGVIDLRFVDRDDASELSDAAMICGGNRVPTVIFLNEDFEFVSILGDRSLTRYRAMAAKALGASCPFPGAPVPADEIAETRQDWLDELERVHLLLRLSPKLRQKHHD